jgi:Zn-dependent metalloprotease
VRILDPCLHLPASGRSCHCTIVPRRVLERFARDRNLPAATRRAFANAVLLDTQWRKVRVEQSRLSRLAVALLPNGLAVPAQPAIEVYSCAKGTALPGIHLTHPATSRDATARQAFEETRAVATFYQTLFGRNSVDDCGKTLVSSVHYSVGYNNAFWNGTQMVYGDGDGEIFMDFTRANDVIAHELTHGVTQYSAGLGYANQAGGLNESLSDVFGSMFRQWQAGQDVASADWLIGSGILGPAALARGYRCLRDMAHPAAKHCLSPQPTRFAQYRDGMDPHDSSGIANFAFFQAATDIGGRSWETAGRIWYRAMTAYRPNPGLRMASFANRIRGAARELYPDIPPVQKAVDQAWKAVGL